MGIEKDIFIMIGNFNESPESEEYNEDDIKLIISKYPNLNELFEKYVLGTIDEVEANQLYFLITKSKIILAALNQYYNQRMAEIVNEEVIRDGVKSEYIVYIDHYKNKIISPYQYIEYAPAASKIESKKILFFKLFFNEIQFALSVFYKDENYQSVDSVRIVPVPRYGSKYNEDDEFECEVLTDSGITTLKLRFDKPISIGDVGFLHSFKYKDTLYKFAEHRNISEENIALTIKYYDETRNKKKFKRFLEDEFRKLDKNNDLIVDLIINNRYIRICFNDDDVLITLGGESFSKMEGLIDYICHEFGLK